MDSFALLGFKTLEQQTLELVHWILKVLGWVPFIKMNESNIYPLWTRVLFPTPNWLAFFCRLAAWSVLPKLVVSQIRTSCVNPGLETKVKHQELDQRETWADLTKGRGDTEHLKPGDEFFGERRRYFLNSYGSKRIFCIDTYLFLSSFSILYSLSLIVAVCVHIFLTVTHNHLLSTNDMSEKKNWRFSPYTKQNGLHQRFRWPQSGRYPTKYATEIPPVFLLHRWNASALQSAGPFSIARHITKIVSITLDSF